MRQELDRVREVVGEDPDRVEIADRPRELSAETIEKGLVGRVDAGVAGSPVADEHAEGVQPARVGFAVAHDRVAQPPAFGVAELARGEPPPLGQGACQLAAEIVAAQQRPAVCAPGTNARPTRSSPRPGALARDRSTKGREDLGVHVASLEMAEVRVVHALVDHGRISDRGAHPGILDPGEPLDVIGDE